MTKLPMLSKGSMALWRKLTAEYLLTDAQREILAAGLSARDRAAQCRERIDRDGLTVTSRLGELRPHPLLSVERDSRAAFIASLRRLNLHLAE